MSYYLTFVAADKKSNPVTPEHFSAFGKNIDWLEPGKAGEILVQEKPAIAALRARLDAEKIDVFVTPTKNRVKKLLVADMDSTIVEGETLDDLAAFAGLKDKIAAITARAMNGELDFEAAVRERVGLLKGLSETKLQDALAQTHLNPGAEIFVRTMKKNGAHCVLVSGGFTVFTAPIAERAGFDNHHGNTLGVESNALDGTVRGAILDKHAKVKFLEQYLKKLGLSHDDALTIGDGANDIPMLKAAGLGIGYKPKPVVAADIENVIIHGDLTTALYAQGIIPD